MPMGRPKLAEEDKRMRVLITIERNIYFYLKARNIKLSTLINKTLLASLQASEGGIDYEYSQQLPWRGRAHNPKIGGSNPLPATIVLKPRLDSGCGLKNRSPATRTSLFQPHSPLGFQPGLPDGKAVLGAGSAENLSSVNQVNISEFFTWPGFSEATLHNTNNTSGAFRRPFLLASNQSYVQQLRNFQLQERLECILCCRRHAHIFPLACCNFPVKGGPSFPAKRPSFSGLLFPPCNGFPLLRRS
jgi:hypothetical protein